jgi:transcriptional regulator with GAF, ATPase, and Fis domain
MDHAAGRSSGRLDVIAGVVGVSAAWKNVLHQIDRVAASETTVLVTGETGAGKEVVANLLHRASLRARKPFVTIDCASLPENFFESELFGHEKGAFTGAAAVRMGRLEQAFGGTLFLDEVAAMSPRVQAKFLRVLEDREYQRLGGTRTLRADVRVIAATNRDLKARMAPQTFRTDLYYRLAVFGIEVPPLRTRPEDILVLAQAFLAELAAKTGRRPMGIEPEACERLVAYPWPGNVRELRNAIERATLLSDGSAISRAHLPERVARAELAGASVLRLEARPSLETMSDEGADRVAVERALAQAMGNKAEAARLLGLTRGQLYWRLEKYSLH